MADGEQLGGPSRMIVTKNPTAEYIRNIPLGSDVIVDTPSDFMAGVWMTQVRDGFAAAMEAGKLGDPAFFAYLPPVPAPDNLPSDDELIDLVIERYWSGIEAAAHGNASASDVMRAVLQATIQLARQGMIAAPW